MPPKPKEQPEQELSRSIPLEEEMVMASGDYDSKGAKSVTSTYLAAEHNAGLRILLEHAGHDEKFGIIPQVRYEFGEVIYLERALLKTMRDIVRNALLALLGGALRKAHIEYYESGMVVKVDKVDEKVIGVINECAGRVEESFSKVLGLGNGINRVSVRELDLKRMQNLQSAIETSRDGIFPAFRSHLAVVLGIIREESQPPPPEKKKRKRVKKSKKPQSKRPRKRKVA